MACCNRSLPARAIRATSPRQRRCFVPPRSAQSAEGEALVAHNQAAGLFGVATVYTRRFTPEEQERLASVANLASLALENARLHDRAQRELAML